MKKVFLSVVLGLCVAASSAFAEVSLNAGVGSFAKQSVTVAGFGIGGQTVTDSNILVGIATNFEGASIKDTNLSTGSKAVNLSAATMYQISVDFKLGYAPTEKIAIYGIGSFMGQGVGSNMGSGFGYGGGISYDVASWLRLAAEYKAYNMSMVAATANVKYDYTQTMGCLEFKF